MKFDIKKLYLYSATLIGLIVTIIGAVQLVDLGLKVFVFRDIDQYYVSSPIYDPVTQSKYTEEELAGLRSEQEVLQKEDMARQKKRQASTAISMLVVSIPVYLYHWKLVNKKEKA